MAEITEEDLTTEGEPSEHYWKTLAERRRQALEDSLIENEMLHEKVDSLKEELNISRQLLDESNALVEVLNEMINPVDESSPKSQSPATDSENEADSTQEISIAEEAKECVANNAPTPSTSFSA